jgi:molecular chaperone HtpG
MRIPHRLAQLLSSDPRLNSAVHFAVNRVEDWMAKSHLTFFPDWTDHGPKHIESVLVTESSLISDEAWARVTPQDAAVLVVASLVHDSAMLLNEDSFRYLVSHPNRTIKQSGDSQWQTIWKEFLIEQQKYGGNLLSGMFEDDDLTILLPADKWTAEHRRVVGGRFLREHHARLAHEIALYGIPSHTGKPFKLIEKFDYELRDIAGFIARSHYMELRHCLSYLKRKYDVREYKSIHPVFLMSLLRVADYLQLQSERAPGEFLRIHKIRDPKSNEEWTAHSAVRDIRQSHEDPKAIFIHAKPREVSTYLKIKNWLRGIQYELDSSWELLDELNGRYRGLQDLALMIRRVRSNLDDVKKFGTTVKFVPDDIQFRAAGGELLKKLVKPLYGDRPEIGLRELLQNSIDAVRERRVYKPSYSPSPIKVADTLRVGVDIVVLFEKVGDDVILTVEDRGIGMNESVIKEFFLTAGRSFRQSREWKSLFLERGKPSLPRSGRFGVGALAAFLLGDELVVTTKHVGNTNGYVFTARLNEDSISLVKSNSVPDGTSIRITLSTKAKEILDELKSFDWYYFNFPKIERIEIEDGSHRLLSVDIPSLPNLPEPSVQWLGPGFPICWHFLSCEGFASIHWGIEFRNWYHREPLNEFSRVRFSTRISLKNIQRPPMLSCNGLVVTSHDEGGSIVRKSGVEVPFLSVVESDQVLPLTLQRNGLEEELPFKKELSADIARSLIAFAILFAPQSRESAGWQGLASLPDNNTLVCCEEGMTILDLGLLLKCGIRTLITIIDGNHGRAPVKKWTTSIGVCFEAAQTLVRLEAIHSGRLFAGGGRMRVVNKLREIYGIADDAPRGTVKSKRLRSGWQSTFGKCPPTVISTTKLRVSHSSVIEAFLPVTASTPPTILERMMMELTGDGLIPYDVGSRRTKLKAAIDELDGFISMYRKIAEDSNFRERFRRPIMPA